MSNLQASDYVAKKYGRVKLPIQNIIEDQSPDEIAIQDLVAIILGTGSKKESVFSMSERIIKDYDSRAIFKIKDPVTLSNMIGITIKSAAKLIAAFELGRRIISPTSGQQILIRGPEDVYETLKDMREYKKEHFNLLCLNTKNIVIHIESVSVGTLSGTLVHPREVFKCAIEHSAGSVVAVHNHPSGEFEPSAHDDSITRMLKEAGDVLQIPLIDHIIVAKNGYYSYSIARKL